jgi:predicted nucleotidyltransferase
MRNLKKMKAINTIPTIKRKVLPILKRHAVKRASIFGSFARGEAKANSDVDFPEFDT